MPLFRRAGRPGLIGTAARTAVIAGTAQATAGAVAARQQRRAEDRAMAAAPPPVQAAPVQAPPPTPAAAGNDLLTQLQQLADLHAQGALTDDEFVAAKTKLLG